MTSPDRRWQTRAACAGMGPDLFFPPPGPDLSGDAAVRALCRTCPVADACLAAGLHPQNIHHGIWAGLRPAERRALRHR